MMKSRRIHVLFLTVGLLSISHSTMQALNSKKIFFYAIVAGIGRLGMKGDPKPDRLGLNDALERIKDCIDKPVSKDMFMTLMLILDDIIIGYAGKHRGLIPLGRKVFADGEMKPGFTETGPNGEVIELRRLDDIPPYGILGSVWGYAKDIIGELSALNDVLSLKDGPLVKHLQA